MPGGTDYLKGVMSTSHVRAAALAASLIGYGIALAVVPTASADPGDPVLPAPPPPGLGPPAQADAAPVQPAPPPPGLGPPAQADAAPPGMFGGGAQPADGGDSAKTACAQFARALNFASINYEDFAYSIAGNGSSVDYADPNVQSNNVAGRTALRVAAASAMDAAATPGLSPDIANPMRLWSVDAAKLLVMMGVRGNGDVINSSATDVNNDTKNVQMACAAAGTHA
jgi:hypothetical protein